MNKLGYIMRIMVYISIMFLIIGHTINIPSFYKNKILLSLNVAGLLFGIIIAIMRYRKMPLLPLILFVLMYSIAVLSYTISVVPKQELKPIHKNLSLYGSSISLLILLLSLILFGGSYSYAKYTQFSLTKLGCIMSPGRKYCPPSTDQ